MNKTNVMRLLDQAKITYLPHEYDPGLTNGEQIAQVLGENPDIVFKTLVCIASSKEHYVFCLPVNMELDLKKAAKTVDEKSIAMIHQKELLPLTGYVHGGCSPIGMKKPFLTVIDESCLLEERIFVSGGKLGTQIEINVNELIAYCHARTADITE